MRKNTPQSHSDISVPRSHPRCMWSILHVFRYHRWRSAKQRLQNKKGGANKHVTGNPGNHTDVLYDENSSQYSNDRSENSSVRNSPVGHKKAPPVPKGSVKSRLKALVYAEVARKKIRHRRSSTCPARSRLTRIESFHHLETPYEKPLAGTGLSNGNAPNAQNAVSSASNNSLQPSIPKSSEDASQVDCGIVLAGNRPHRNLDDETGKKPNESLPFLHENPETKEQKEIHGGEVSMDIEGQQSTEDMDALNMINTEELLIKVLNDPGSPLARYFHNPPAAGSKLRYSKSESFPSRGLSNRRGSRSSKLKQKREVIESPVKEGKLKADCETPPVELNSRDYNRSKSMSFVCRADGTLKLKRTMTANLSPGTVHHLKEHSQNQVAMRRFKDLKQKIKHAIRESKEEKRRIAMDAVLHKIPRGQRFPQDLTRQSSDYMKNHSVCGGIIDGARTSYDSDHSLTSTSGGAPKRISRTKSLKESLDRYCQLYQSSFNREAKPRNSDTFKLRAENAASPVISAPKSMTRIFSLPNLDACGYYSDDSSDSALSWNQTRSPSDGVVGLRRDLRQQKSQRHLVASGFLSPLDKRSLHNDTLYYLNDESYAVDGEQLATTSAMDSTSKVKRGLIADDLSNLMAEDKAYWDEEDDFQALTESLGELGEPGTLPASDSYFQEDAASFTNLPTLGDIDQNLRRLLSSKLDALEEDIADSSNDIPRVTDAVVDTMQPGSNYIKDEFLHSHFDAKDKAAFLYVKEILELSGFTRNDPLGTWHSVDQPLDPELFLELEGCSTVDPDSSGNDMGSNYFRLLLFDLINEVLLDIYTKSSSYYPVALSSVCRIRRMPIGHRVVEEVWTDVRWHLSSSPDPELLLEHIVSRDLAKPDGWMNLQFDLECEALELEDWIFDDLLDELLCVCF